MCRVLGVHPSRFYAWLHEPKSQRAKDDEYLLGFIKQFWLESGSVYGYRKIYKDMLAIGEQFGKTACTVLCESLKYSQSVVISEKRIIVVAKYQRLPPTYLTVNLILLSPTKFG